MSDYFKPVPLTPENIKWVTAEEDPKLAAFAEAWSSANWVTIPMADFEEAIRKIPLYEYADSRVQWIVKKSFYLAVLAAAKREKKLARKARLIRENRCKR